MALRTVPQQYSFDSFRVQHNLLAADVGDIALLTTSVTSSVVAALNNLQFQISELVLGEFSLPNDTFFTAGAFGGGNQNVFKVNQSNKVEFGAPVVGITIESGSAVFTTPLGVASGGTGGGTILDAQTALQLLPGTNVQAWSESLDDIAGIAKTSGNFIVANGSNWIAHTPSQVRTLLSLVVGTNVQAWATGLDQLGALVPTANTFLMANAGGTAWQNRDAAAVRSVLGLNIGSTVQAYSASLQEIAGLSKTLNNIIVSNGSAWTVANGGTARAVLGLTIGTNVQAWATGLDQLSGLTPSSGNVVIGNGSAWVAQSGATLRSSIGLAIGTNVQAWSSRLDNFSGVTPTAGRLLAADGSLWYDADAATVRGLLGLGVFATMSSPIPHGNGGTGISTTPTNGQLLIGNGSGFSLAALTGTANQITITNGSGTITLSLPQNIASTSSPTFSGLTLNALNASQYVKTNAGKTLVSASTIPTSDLSSTRAIWNPNIILRNSSNTIITTINIADVAMYERTYEKIGGYVYFRICVSFNLSGTGNRIRIPLPIPASNDHAAEACHFPCHVLNGNAINGASGWSILGGEIEVKLQHPTLGTVNYASGGTNISIDGKYRPA